MLTRRLLSLILLAGASGVLQAEDQLVTGICQVNLGPYIQKREACEFLTPDQEVPAGHRLIIEHVSAACSTSADRPVHTLSLITKVDADVRAIPTYVPMTLQATSVGGLRYVGSQQVRIYAGERTAVELFARTWEQAPAGDTSCQLTFSGVLVRLSQ